MSQCDVTKLRENEAFAGVGERTKFLMTTSKCCHASFTKNPALTNSGKSALFSFTVATLSRPLFSAGGLYSFRFSWAPPLLSFLLLPFNNGSAVNTSRRTQLVLHLLTWYLDLSSLSHSVNTPTRSMTHAFLGSRDTEMNMRGH